MQFYESVLNESHRFLEGEILGLQWHYPVSYWIMKGTVPPVKFVLMLEDSNDQRYVLSPDTANPSGHYFSRIED